MASRQVRKLLQAQAEAELAKHAIASDEDDESEQAGASKPFNPFDLLSDEEVSARHGPHGGELTRQPSQPSWQPSKSFAFATFLTG
jgi:hypothetical protein